MDRRRALVGVSAAQLVAGIAGERLAVRRRLTFDIAVISWSGRPDRIAHDTWLLGSALSAPRTMLATQAAAMVRLAQRDEPAARRVLGLLGATMAAGYLVEREFRSAMRPGGWDVVITPVAAAGAGLAVAMAALGLGGPSPEVSAGRR